MVGVGATQTTNKTDKQQTNKQTNGKDKKVKPKGFKGRGVCCCFSRCFATSDNSACLPMNCNYVRFPTVFDSKKGERKAEKVPTTHTHTPLSSSRVNQTLCSHRSFALTLWLFTLLLFTPSTPAALLPFSLSLSSFLSIDWIGCVEKRVSSALVLFSGPFPPPRLVFSYLCHCHFTRNQTNKKKANMDNACYTLINTDEGFEPMTESELRKALGLFSLPSFVHMLCVWECVSECVSECVWE